MLGIRVNAAGTDIVNGDLNIEAGDVVIAATGALEVQDAGSLAAPAVSVGVVDSGMFLNGTILSLVSDGSASGPGLTIDQSDNVAIPNGSLAIGTPTISSGTGSPEGVVTAPIGSLFMRSDGGAITSLYVKESGTGNTGWVAK